MASNSSFSWERKGMADTFAKGERANAGAVAALIKQSETLQDDTIPGSLVIFDGACGTGVVASQLYQLAREKERDISVTCGDLSPEMIAYVEERITKEGWTNATAKVVDLQDTKLPTEHFDRIIISLGILLLPKPFDAIRECIRITKPGGIIAFSCVNRVGWVPDVSKALENVPGASPLPENYPRQSWAKTGNWHDPAWVKESLALQFPRAFQDINAQFYEHSWSMDNVDDYMDFLMKVPLPGVIDSQGWTEEEKAEKTPILERELRKILGEQPVSWVLSLVHVVAKKVN